jgi:hypothetical protein
MADTTLDIRRRLQPAQRPAPGVTSEHISTAEGISLFKDHPEVYLRGVELQIRMIQIALHSSKLPNSNCLAYGCHVGNLNIL